MSSAVYDNYIVHQGIGEIKWYTGETDIYTLLCNNTAPNKSHAHYSSVQGQLPEGNGYNIGGKLLTIATPVTTDNITKFDATNLSWTNATITAHYAIVYHNAGTPPLISYHDFGADKSVVSGTLLITWHTDGVFKMTSDPAS